jgi:AcrR family transcriptional regulator
VPPSGKGSAGNGARPRGRPRRDINLDAVADAVAELFAEGGQDAVSVAEAAEKLSVSRATLYRTVPTKDDLLGILFERSTRELTEHARALLKQSASPRDQLREMIRLQVDAAIRMRRYLPVFFGGGDLPSEVVSRWHLWSREFEALWVGVVTEAMRAGELDEADPVITARLLLGMCIWVSRWYRPDGPYDADRITEAAIRLLRLSPPGPGEPARAPDPGAATPTSRRKPRARSSPRAGRASR